MTFLLLSTLLFETTRICGEAAWQVRRIAGRGAGVAPLDGRKVGDPEPELLLQEGGFHGLAQLGGAGAGVGSAR